MSAALEAAISATTMPVRQGAASIEGAFLAAGDGLGRGLDSFEALEARLSALTVELSDEAMTKAMQSLGEVAVELVRISDGLPVDGATLSELVGCNRAVESRLQGLMEKMRMMFTLARAARIEAASIDQSSVDFVHFTLEIMALTRSVQDDIGLSARGQLKLAGLLQTALQAQSAFEHQHRRRLLDLATELTDAVAILSQRQASGADIMQQLSVRSRRMGDAVRTAIMALQMGDTTRQRLEHVDEGLVLALDHAEGALPGLMPCFGGLLAALLADAARAFAGDAGQIDGAFAALLRDAQDLVDLGRSCNGQGADRAETALDAVGERVTRATSHIGECEAARRAVDETILRLREQLADVDGAVSKVSTVIADIVLIGVNAGLRAGRLGQEGRSLVVIAQELKSLATGIAEDAKVLLVLLAKLGSVAARLDRSGEAAGAGSVAHAMAGVLDGLRASADRVGAALRDIERTGGDFQANLSGVRARFTDAAAFNDELSEIAAELDEAAAADTPEDLSGIREIIDAAMGPRYTMARERQIHEEALDWIGPAPARLPPPSAFGELRVA